MSSEEIAERTVTAEPVGEVEVEKKPVRRVTRKKVATVEAAPAAVGAKEETPSAAAPAKKRGRPPKKVSEDQGQLDLVADSPQKVEKSAESEPVPAVETEPKPKAQPEQKSQQARKPQQYQNRPHATNSGARRAPEEPELRHQPSPRPSQVDEPSSDLNIERASEAPILKLEDYTTLSIDERARVASNWGWTQHNPRSAQARSSPRS